jgi:predicted Zn-dependent protease
MPGQFDARLLLGKVYLQLKDANAAEDQFEAAQLLQPKSVEAQLGIARAQIARKDFAQALGGLEPLAKQQPDNAEVFELLAQAYAAAGKNPEAQQAETRVRQLRARSVKP